MSVTFTVGGTYAQFTSLQQTLFITGLVDSLSGTTAEGIRLTNNGDPLQVTSAGWPSVHARIFVPSLADGEVAKTALVNYGSTSTKLGLLSSVLGSTISAIGTPEVLLVAFLAPSPPLLVLS